jgi:DnaJ-class molecular chaperone
MFDPYGELGISKTASQDEIKKAYRKLAKQFHPDLNPGKKHIEDRFKNVTRAYELIGTKEKRVKFDRGEAEESPFQGYGTGAGAGANAGAGRGRKRTGPYYYQTQAGPDGGRYTRRAGGYRTFEGFSEDELFSSIFESMAGSQGDFRTGGFDTKGKDQLYRMDVEFKEAALGAQKEITLPNGKRLLVKIPPGVKTGSKLRLKGYGKPGLGKGIPGDTYVELNVKPSDAFKRNDRNVEVEVPLPLSVAVLGGELRVPTLDGNILMKVPEFSDSDTKLRVRKKGILDPISGERGDQIVRFKLVLPKAPDAELQEAIRSWDEKKKGENQGRSKTAA